MTRNFKTKDCWMSLRMLPWVAWWVLLYFYNPLERLKMILKGWRSVSFQFEIHILSTLSSLKCVPGWVKLLLWHSWHTYIIYERFTVNSFGMWSWNLWILLHFYACWENYSLYTCRKLYLLESTYCRHMDCNKYTTPTVICFNV